MKIAFIFTEKADLADVPAGGRFRCNFEVPDTAKALPDIQARVIAIGDLVGQLTWANIHLTCPEIDLKNHLIKPTGFRPEYVNSLDHSAYTLGLYFILHTPRAKRRKLVIYAPIEVPIYHPGQYLLYPLPKEIDPRPKIFADRLKLVFDQLLVLLNADNPVPKWEQEGFIPWLQLEGYRKQRQTFNKLRAQGKQT